MQITVLGTPAEEGQGGKINLIEAGVFDDVDVAMMVHPTPITVSHAKPNRILELEGMELSIKNITLHISYIVRWFIEGLPRTVASC
jgi:metal-dependent amidase/aminoacylase/carboxypeptidase family protein